MLFIVSIVLLPFIASAGITGALTGDQLVYAVLGAMMLLGIGAGGMGLEVAAERDE